MPLWSVEEWRARIGSSWAALGRTFPSCQSSHKEWRHRPSRRGGGEGGPMVVSTVPVTTFMLMCTTVSLTVAQPAVDDGHSTVSHSKQDSLMKVLLIWLAYCGTPQYNCR